MRSDRHSGLVTFLWQNGKITIVSVVTAVKISNCTIPVCHRGDFFEG